MMAVGGVTLTGANTADFGERTTGSSLAAGATCTAYVICKPSMSRSETSQLVVGGGTDSPPAVTLSGAGQ
jgi:hypothetical protein